MRFSRQILLSIFFIGVHTAVLGLDAKPIIVGQLPVSTNEDTDVTLTSANLIFIDLDLGDTHTVVVKSGAGYTFSGSTVTPAENINGPLHVNITLFDGTEESDEFDFVITVNAVNDIPVINGQDPLATNEDQSMTITLGDLDVTDVDNPGYPAGFTLTVQPGANYNVVGATITPLANYAGPLTVPVRVSDGTDLSEVFDLAVTVNAVNDPPVAGNDVATTPEDTPVTFDILSNDSDLEAPPAAGTVDLDPSSPSQQTSVTTAEGVFNVAAGMVTFTPAANFASPPTAVIHYTVNDTDGATSNEATITVTVTAVNDPPVVGNDVATTQEDTPVTFNILSNDSDPETSIVPGTIDLDPSTPSLQASITTSEGTFSVAGGMVTFTPVGNFSSPPGAVIQYTVNDTGGATSNQATITVTVTPANDPPVINSQNAVATNEEQAVTLTTAMLNVTDPDNAYPTGFTVSAGTGTNYTVSGGNIITPAANYAGTLTVPVQVNDGNANSNTFSLTITVNAVNDAPVINGQSTLSTNEDQPIVLNLANLTVTDVDNAYPTGFTMVLGTGTNYTFTGLTVTPALNFNGTLTVPVHVNDGTSNSNTFNLAITVTPVNDAPVITGQDALSVNEDQPLALTLGDLTITDADNTPPTGFTLTVLTGTNYTVAGTTITPASNFSGTLTVPVRVNDGTTNSANFNLSVTVNAANDAPVINSQSTVSTNEDTPFTIQFAHLGVTDPDNTYPAGFSLSVSGGSNYSVAGTTVTPSSNFSGTLTIPVTVNDGTSASNTFNFILTVNAANDAPVITGQTALSVNEDQSITVSLAHLTVTDPDDAYPADFTLTVLSGSNYTFSGATVTPNANFSGTLNVNVRVHDGTANSPTFSLAITVNPLNDAPVITGQTPLTINEDTPITIQPNNIVVSDPDNAYPAGFTLTVSAGSNYSLSGNTVTPNAHFSGTLSVPVQVNDGTSGSNTFMLSITVNAVNDPPVITGQTALGVNEDSPLTLALANLTVSDPDNASGFTLTVQAGTNYTFSGNTITPVSNFSGTLTVNVKVSDGNSDSAPFGVTVTVNPINDTPVINGQTALSTNEEQAITLTLANLTVTDPDDTYPDNFTLTVLAGTNYTVAGATVTPNANFSGTLTVPVRVNDGTANSAQFNVSVTVTGVNDAPVITGQQPLTLTEDNTLTLLPAHLTVTDPDNSFPTGFTLTVSPGANYTASGNTITPASNYNGVLSVPVTVNDGVNNSNSFNVQITVTGVNDAPVITGQNPLNTGESQPITLSLGQLFVLDPDDSYPADFALFVLSGANYSVSGTTVTPAANFSGQLLVKVLVNDGSANSPTYDLQILVNSVNDPPTITGQQTLSVTEDNAITLVPSNLTVSDPDNTYPTGFTITVLPGANYTFSGLTITPAGNFTGPLSVSVKVNDGLSDSAPFNLLISVTAANDAPVITGQQPLNTTEDQPLTVQFTNLVVVDPDDTYPTGFSLTVLTGTNYTVSGNTITPALNYSGMLTVPVRVNDGSANSPTFNLQVQVDAQNDAPVISGQTALSTAEDTPIVVKLADLTVTDVDNTFPAGFSLAILSGTNYTFLGTTVTPALNFNGTLTVNITVNDGSATSAVFPLKVQVASVNTPPTITGQKTLATNEEAAITINLTDLTVVDPDDAYPTGFTLTVNSGANYTVAGTTVTPAANYNGNLSVPVRVNDGVNNSPVFNLLVKVDPVNDAPVITGQSTLTVNEDQPLAIQLTHLQVTDVDDAGYPAGFTLSVASGTGYTVSGNTITPTLNFNGNLSVNVTVSDGSNSSAVFPLVVKVNPVNDPPTTTGFTASVIDEDNTGETVVSLLNTFHDAEDNVSTLSYQIMANDNAAFFQSIAINQAAGELRYKVKPNVFGTAKVTVKATDTGGQAVQDVLTIIINAVNDAPSFDAITNKVVIENSPQQTVNITNISKGPFENSQNLNIFATSGNTSVVPDPEIIYDGISATAQLKYTIQPDKSGIVNINIFAIDDGSNAMPNRNSFTTSFQIEVVQVNNAPTLNAIAFGPIQEDAPEQSIALTGISAGAGETDQTLTVAATHNKPDILEAAVIEYTSAQPTGTLKLKPKPNASGTVQVTVTVTDSGPGVPSPNVNQVSRAFNLVVQPVNDLPVFTSEPGLQAAVSEAYTYAVRVMDVDNNTVALTAIQKPAWVNFTADADGKKGTLSGTPAAADAGNSVIRLQAKDANGAPVVQEFTLNVNTRPVVSPFELTSKEDILLAFDPQKFAAAFADPDGSTLAAIRIERLPNPVLGQLKFNNAAVAAGDEIPFASIANLAYQPMADTSGIDTVYFKGSDGMIYSEKSAFIRISITPVNDAPIISRIEPQTDALVYEIGVGPRNLTVTFDAFDPDYDSLENAEVGFRIQNYEVNLDELLFTDTEHIKGTFNIQAGTLSMNGKAPVAEYIAFIKGIQYNYDSPSLPRDTVKITYVTISDGNQLSETKDRFIHLRYSFEELSIMSGFTPNGDNKNETWVPIDPVRNAEFRDSELKIYDKRGRLLFETVGFEQEWDGTMNGDPLPAESYYFTLDLKLPFIKKTYKGVVTILR